MNAAVIKANVVVFIASFCTLVIELVAGRIMAPYVGVSLYTWTSIIGVVLAGISIGAYLGGIIADRYPRQTTLGWLLFLSGLGAFSISPLTNLIGAAQFQSTLMMRIMILTTVIFFVPSAVLGMISPVVVKLTLDNLEKTGNVVGKIYAFSTLGSIIGTFTTGFYLISWMGTRNILLIIGVILIASALVFGGFFMRRKSLAVFILVFAPLTWALYGVAFKAPLDAKIYYYKESDYYTIKLMKYGANKDGRVLHAMILDNLVHSLNDLEDPVIWIIPISASTRRSSTGRRGNGGTSRPSSSAAVPTPSLATWRRSTPAPRSTWWRSTPRSRRSPTTAWGFPETRRSGPSTRTAGGSL